MSRFSIRYPYLIIVICLMVCVIGITSIVRMPVDLFPSIKIPVVVVATFYSGMPPEQIENDITGRFERFFTLGSGIDHIESRSLPGVSLIKVYFQPGTNADSAVTTISNLAMAQLRRLPPGTLPPVVLKFDASSLPVCLITLKGEGLNETQLRDLGQFAVRNQVANVQGASVPQPFGGRYRQIMVYVDPLKLEAHQLSVMDVVRSVNDSNLILPAGDVKIGPIDYGLYTNSQLRGVKDISKLPLKTVNGVPVMLADVGHAEDGAQIQTNVVRVDGQKSAYLPVLKQGGDANTIAVVNGIKKAVSDLLDVPKSLVANVVFDQSVFVKTAIENLLHEGAIGLVLTGLMILIFLGNVRATIAVFLSIPLSALATFIALSFGDNSINSMILGGLALAFSRLIDNSVVVLENIFRHLENGETPEVAAEKGGAEVALPVLAATLTTAVVFFPVTFLYGVSRFLFTALALSVVLSLFASYVVAMSVVPLFCAKLIKAHQVHGSHEHELPSSASIWVRFNFWFNRRFHAFLDRFDRAQTVALARPAATVIAILGLFALSFGLIPAVGMAYFPRTDPGQFVINLKAPTGTRLEATEKEVKKVEDLVRRIVDPKDLRLIVSNLGATPDFSAIYTSNSASHTAFVQVSLQDDHKVGSYEYMERVRKALRDEIPELSAYFQSGGLVDAVLNLGQPAPIDIQVSGSNLNNAYTTAAEIAAKVKGIPGVSDLMIPQDIDMPSLRLEIDRTHAAQLGLSEKEVVNNVITALTSNAMIAPSFWVDETTGNDYMLTVQYPETTIKTLSDLKGIPLRADHQQDSARLDAVTKIIPAQSPTEVDHFQLRRVIDIFVSPRGEELGRIASAVENIVKGTNKPEGVRIAIHGSVQAMNSSFTSFGFGLVLSLVLVYLILVAQFKSFIDPLLILLAVPPGIAGVIVMLATTGTTLNVMSLMGVVMMAGIVVSNSILIVEFTHRLIEDGMPLRDAVQHACRVRLRPILMTSLATIIGLIPMALKLGTGSEAYAPLARAIIGGLLVSVVLTVFIVPAAFYIVYRRREPKNDNPSNDGPSTLAGGGQPAAPIVSAVIAIILAVAASPARAADAQPIQHLTLEQAEAIALQHDPAIAESYFHAQAAREQVTQARSAFFPQVYGDIALVGSGSDVGIGNGVTRIGASGGLNNPSVYSRESNGIGVSQLITDFGRTSYLTTAARFDSLAAGQLAELTRAQVLSWTDQAYFRALEGEALVHVANETIANRQLIMESTAALAANQLKSSLDVSFAEVGLQQAKLLLLNAQNKLNGAFADLSAALGYREPHRFVLEEKQLKAPTNDVNPLATLIARALMNRPDAIAAHYRRDSALKKASAEKVAGLPRVDMLATVGRTPTGDPVVRETYAAAGINVSIPIFTGGRITARAREVAFEAQAAQKFVDETEQRIVRDVNLAWLNSTEAQQRIEVTKQELKSANEAWELAKARYQTGITSIVELSQAELNRTQALIDNASAGYDYDIALALLQYQIGELKVGALPNPPSAAPVQKLKSPSRK